MAFMAGMGSALNEAQKARLTNFSMKLSRWVGGWVGGLVNRCVGKLGVWLCGWWLCMHVRLSLKPRLSGCRCGSACTGRKQAGCIASDGNENAHEVN